MGLACQLVREDPSGVTEGSRKEQEGMPAMSHKLELDVYWLCRAVTLETLREGCSGGRPLALLMHQSNLDSPRRQHLERGDSHIPAPLGYSAEFSTCPSAFCCLRLEESLVLWVEAFLPCVRCAVWICPCLPAFSVPWGDKHFEASASLHYDCPHLHKLYEVN